MGWVEMILHLAYDYYCGFHGLDFHCFYWDLQNIQKVFPSLPKPVNEIMLT